MLRMFLAPTLVFTAVAGLALPARGVPMMLPDAGQALLCRGAIAAAESATRIPDAFLSAIGRVESGRTVSNGLTAPWPWTVNAAGAGHFYASKAEAVAAVHQFQANGIKSLDVGCLQVNIMYHPDAFASPDQAFDPATNVAYAARMLMSLHAQLGSWPKAAAAYHSQTPSLGQAYQEKVLAAWAEPDQSVSPSPKISFQRPEMTKAPTPPGPAAIAALPAVPMNVSYSHVTRLPAAPGGIGRSLAAYRSMPVQMASRAPVVSAQY
jgi:hypothetical protein